MRANAGNRDGGAMSDVVVSLRTASRPWRSQDTDPWSPPAVIPSRTQGGEHAQHNAGPVEERVHAHCVRQCERCRACACGSRACSASDRVVRRPSPVLDSPPAVLTDLDDVGPLDFAQGQAVLLGGSCGGRASLLREPASALGSIIQSSCRVPSRDRMIARSMTFSSSRTLPGQEYAASGAASRLPGCNR